MANQSVLAINLLQVVDTNAGSSSPASGESPSSDSFTALMQQHTQGDQTRPAAKNVASGGKASPAVTDKGNLPVTEAQTKVETDASITMTAKADEPVDVNTLQQDDELVIDEAAIEQWLTFLPKSQQAVLRNMDAAEWQQYLTNEAELDPALEIDEKLLHLAKLAISENADDIETQAIVTKPEVKMASQATQDSTDNLVDVAKLNGNPKPAVLETGADLALNKVSLAVEQAIAQNQPVKVINNDGESKTRAAQIDFSNGLVGANQPLTTVKQTSESSSIPLTMPKSIEIDLTAEVAPEQFIDPEISKTIERPMLLSAETVVSNNNAENTDEIVDEATTPRPEEPIDQQKQNTQSAERVTREPLAAASVIQPADANKSDVKPVNTATRPSEPVSATLAENNASAQSDEQTHSEHELLKGQGEARGQNDKTTSDKPAQDVAAFDRHWTAASQSGDAEQRPITSNTLSASALQAAAETNPAAKLQSAVMQNEVIAIHRRDFVNQIQDRVLMMINQRLQKVEIRLDPPELGSMHIKVNMSGEQAVVNFVVQNQQAKDVIEQNLVRLREMMSEQGVGVADANVKQQQQGREDNLSGQEQNRSGQHAGWEGSDDVVEINPRLIESSASGIDYYV